MANRFVSFLEHVGKDIAKVFTSPITQDIERGLVVAGGMLFPGLGPLFNTVANAAITAEQSAAVVGQQSGSGAQKLSNVVQIVGPLVTTTLGALGKPNAQADVVKYVNAVVAVLNSIPAPTPTTGG